MPTVDLSVSALRDLNQALHRQGRGTNETVWDVVNPRGLHAVAVGIKAPISVAVRGSVGYYCAGMNQEADVTVHGSAGPGVAENMMSGRVTVKGDASQYAGATGKGGLLVIEGNASSRCGISMKGIDIVVRGNVGHMSAFMAQAGNLVVCGDAGDALGRFDLRGATLRARRGEEPRRGLHREADAAGASRGAAGPPGPKAGMTDVRASEFKRYGSARKLYNFNIEVARHADAYGYEQPRCRTDAARATLKRIEPAP